VHESEDVLLTFIERIRFRHSRENGNPEPIKEDIGFLLSQE
jgi:hypothetical protein